MKILFFLFLQSITFVCAAENLNWKCNGAAMVSVLASPDKWAGKYISISGVLAFDGEYINSHLYIDQFSFDNKLVQNSVYLDLQPKEKNLSLANGKVALVCGKISLRKADGGTKEAYVSDAKYIMVGDATWEEGKWDFQMESKSMGQRP